ncbi:MAG: sarcosine oxidase subunit gamma family protein [Pseudomonadota bacterium]
MTAPVRRSPLAHRRPLAGGGAVRIAELPLRALFSLRGEADRMAESVGATLGLTLPGAVRETVRGEGAAALWLGPDEWLLVVEEAEASAKAAALETALGGTHHQLVELSDYYTAIDVRGPRARDLLAKLVAVDLHPTRFGAGDVVATKLAKATTWLWLTEDEGRASGPSFSLFVRRSMADYAWCLLAEAGREWGVEAQRPIGDVPLHRSGSG